jgi:hypothetical protein
LVPRTSERYPPSCTSTVGKPRRAIAAPILRKPSVVTARPCERIVLGSIKAERDHERAGRAGTNGFLRDLERGEIAVIPSAERQRNIEVGPQACAFAALMGVAPDIRIVEGRIGVDRDGEDIAAFVEDALRAVHLSDSLPDRALNSP